MFKKAVDSLGEALASGKSILRILFALVILVLVLWQCSLTNGLMRRTLATAELRHDVINNAAFVEGAETEAVIFLENGGGQAASNVTIHVSAPPNTLDDYRIKSPELFKVVQADLAEGFLYLTLERLAAGARVQVNLEIDRSGLEAISVAAASDQGVSRPMDEPTTLRRMSDLADAVSDTLLGAISIVWNNGPVLTVRGFMSDIGVSDYVTGPAFLTAALTTLAAAVFIFLFLPDNLWGIIALIVGLFAWIFLNIQVPVWLIVGLAALILIGFVLLDNDLETGERALGVAVIVFFAAMCTWWQSGNTMGIGFFIGIAVAAGVAYLLEEYVVSSY